jgi:cytochrome d ubiquinol oxidase subunit II
MSVGVVALILMVVSVAWQHSLRGTTWSLILGVLAVVSLLAAIGLTRAERDGWAFVASALSTALLVMGWFASLYPDVFPSTLNPAFSLNIENAASTPYTLQLMSWIALIFSPLILAYQAWSYWVFRKRISVRQIPESPTQVPVH